jgi:hypothetical protein
MKGVKVRLEAFGKLRLHVGETPVTPFGKGMPQPWQMFILMAMQKDRYMSGKDLIANLWKGGSREDAKNSLKNLALRLKKELTALADFEGEPISRAGSGYRLSDVFEIEIDFLAPSDELVVYTFRAMSMLGMCRAVLTLYEKTVRDFAERMEPGSPILGEIREIAQNARLLIAQREKAAASISRAMSCEILEADNPVVVGSYDELNRLCREYPGHIAMAVFTFRMPSTPEGAAGMNDPMRQFQEATARTLHGQDADGQLLVMLPERGGETPHETRERLHNALGDDRDCEVFLLDDARKGIRAASPRL